MYFNGIPSNYSNFSQSGVVRSGQILVASRGLQHINCILPSQNNRGALYLGDVVCLLKSQLLQKHQIKSVLTCMVEPISRGQYNIAAHKILPIRDTIEFPIKNYFIQANMFINQARSKGLNVLVHCHAGVSRSASIVCAYLMQQNKWDLAKSLQYVRQRRYRAKPNASFIEQLDKFFANQVKNKINNTQPNIYGISKPMNTQNNNLSLIDQRQKRMKQIDKKTHITIKQQQKSLRSQQKSLIIVLDQQTQIHDELLMLEQKIELLNMKMKKMKALGKTVQKPQSVITYDLPSKKMNLRNEKDLSVINLKNEMRQGVKSGRDQPKLQKLNLNCNTQQNKYLIQFNKVRGPQFSKSTIVQNGDYSSSTRYMDPTGRMHLSPRYGNLQQSLAKSMVSPNKVVNLEGSKINMYSTPTKQKSMFINNRIGYSNTSNVEPEINSYTSYTQKTNKNNNANRFSLNANIIAQYRQNQY